MKKFFALFMVVIILLSFSACSATVDTPDGQTVEVQNGEEVFEHTATWTVAKVEWSSYYIANGKPRDAYLATLYCDKYVVVVSVGVKEYAAWQPATVVEARYSETYSVTWEQKVGIFETETNTFGDASCFAIDSSVFN